MKSGKLNYFSDGVYGFIKLVYLAPETTRIIVSRNVFEDIYAYYERRIGTTVADVDDKAVLRTHVGGKFIEFIADPKLSDDDYNYK